MARSNEVKALGVTMGMPWFQMQELARRHGIIALSSNYTLYGDMSNRVMTVLRDFSPAVEVYSIDESFLSLNGLQPGWPTPAALGQAIRQRVRQWTGLPVCVGIAPSKTLAKLANHIAKQRVEFNSVCDLTAMPPGQRDALLSSIEVGEVWGVGRQIGEQLRRHGIETVHALKQASPSWLRAQFGVVIERTHRELQGVSCLALDQVAAPKQQIVSSRSFGILVTSLDALQEAVSTYLSSAAEKLRRQGSVCGSVHVFIQTNRFRTHDRQYANGITIALPEPSSDTRTLLGAALYGLRRIYQSGFRYKKAGVMLLALSDAQLGQRALFDDGTARQRSERLMATVDLLNQQHGRATVRLAAAGASHSWRMRSQHCTPRYTTDWSEVPIALAK